MSDDVLVRVENVSKRFCRSLKRSLWYGLQDLGSELGGRRHGGGGGLPQSSADVELRKDEFWAVKDVSFELRRGECLGLIGRNGAGKTTLLRMLNGLIKPDTGRIEMKGSVGALISLGAGFNPILSGRENIHINASLLGLSLRDTKTKIEQIIDFSELGNFIDSPIQSYSSGMAVRLGFAIATTLKPDILILDEVLAVGDQAFRSKCLRKIDSIRESTATIFVSHELGQIKHVSSCGLVLNKGVSEGRTHISIAIENYRNIDTAKEKQAFTSIQTDEEYVNYPNIRSQIDSGEYGYNLNIKLADLAKKEFLIKELRIAVLSEDRIVHVLRQDNLNFKVSPSAAISISGNIKDLGRGTYGVNVFISRLIPSGSGVMALHAVNIDQIVIVDCDIIEHGCSHIGPLNVSLSSDQ